MRLRTKGIVAELENRRMASAYGIQQKGLRIQKLTRGGSMDANEQINGMGPITDPKDISDALDTIKSVEMMGYALEAEKFQLRFAKGMFHCMDILRHIHDDLVSRLPKEVIEAEQAKANPQAPRPAPKIITPDTVPAGRA